MDKYLVKTPRQRRVYSHASLPVFKQATIGSLAKVTDKTKVKRWAEELREGGTCAARQREILLVLDKVHIFKDVLESSGVGHSVNALRKRLKREQEEEEGEGARGEKRRKTGEGNGHDQMDGKAETGEEEMRADQGEEKTGRGERGSDEVLHLASGLLKKWKNAFVAEKQKMRDRAAELEVTEPFRSVKHTPQRVKVCKAFYKRLHPGEMKTKVTGLRCYDLKSSALALKMETSLFDRYGPRKPQTKSSSSSSSLSFKSIVQPVRAPMTSSQPPAFTALSVYLTRARSLLVALSTDDAFLTLNKLRSGELTTEQWVQME